MNRERQCSQYKNNRSSVTIAEKRKSYSTKPDAAFFGGIIEEKISCLHADLMSAEIILGTHKDTNSLRFIEKSGGLYYDMKYKKCVNNK